MFAPYGWHTVQVMFEGVRGSVWGLPRVSYEIC